MSRQRADRAEIVRLQALRPAAPGNPTRVPPTDPSELRPLARIVAGAAARLTASGPPHIFTTLGQNPRLFRAWLCYSAHLMPFGRLSRRDAELVILRVAWRSRSAYEWHQHVPIALRVGLSPDEIAAVAEPPATAEPPAVADRPAAAGLDRRQQTLLDVSDQLLTQRALSDATWSAVQAQFTTRETIELCLLVGHYQGLASAIGGLGIQVEQSPPG